MNYYDMPKEFIERTGIDYDLGACLNYNPQNTFTLEDIAKVLAVFEGERDSEDWRWVLQLNDNRFVFLQGGCDYTGWDCQSWATHKFCNTPEECAKCALGDVPIGESGPQDAGLGHMINILGGTYADKFQEVFELLSKQLAEGKNKTWSENTSDLFRADS